MTEVSHTIPVHHRVRLGLRRPSNWLQLVRFGVVGASGFGINLAVFALLVHAAGLDYRIANVVAYLVAVSSNFALNRLWTFAEARDAHAGFQAVRFFVVSLGAQVVSFALVQLLVESAGVDRVPAQAVAIACAMPLNFLGNKLWSFRG